MSPTSSPPSPAAASRGSRGGDAAARCGRQRRLRATAARHGGGSRARGPSGCRWGCSLGARSGDKGGAANVGVWVPDPVEPQAVALAWGETDALTAPSVDSEHDTAALWDIDTPVDPDADVTARADAAFGWLASWLTPERVRELLPETESLRVDTHPLPNLRAVNIVVHGLLGRGVADSTRLDPQAKGLGEQLRARYADIPADLIDPEMLALWREGHR